MADEQRDSDAGSWRLALMPGQSHDFSATPGWWDARDLAAVVADADDYPRLRAALVRAYPPLPDDTAVLDLGAGTGTLVELVARYYPDVRFTLVDGNPAALARARRKLEAVLGHGQLTFRVEAVDPHASEPFPGGPFILVTSSIALHDIVRPASPDDVAARAEHHSAHLALLRRILASLEPGGHFVYADALFPGFRVAEHLATLTEAGFADVDCAYVLGRLAVLGGRRPPTSAVSNASR